MRNCPSCLSENPGFANFCNNCGHKLDHTQTGSSPVRKAERRQLTILFCDLVGSTALSEKLDAEDYREVILGYHRVAEAVVKRYGGHVAQYLGDGLLVYFGYPRGLEDAPRAGTRAGLGILEAVSHANEQWAAAGKTAIEVRIGIHTGVVVVDDHLALGDTTNIAARLEGLAPTNGVVISPQTLRLVKGWFEVKSTGKHTLKGISQPLEVFQVLRESGARTRLEIAKTGGLSPLVGRREEFRLLQDKWQEIKRGNGQVVLLNGEAGIGKSRLTDTMKEYVAKEAESWLTEIRCSSYHQNSSFFPIIELLENVVLDFKPADTLDQKLGKLEGFLLQSGMNMDLDPALFAQLLSLAADRYPPLNLSPMAKKMRIIEGLTKGLLHRAGIQPVLLLVEDLHWADPSTLEWLNSFLSKLPEFPILMLCTTRPNYDPQWDDLPDVSRLDLHRLNAEQISRICRFHAKEKELPAEVLDQIIAKTGGVPLFVEELIKMVLESRIMIEGEDNYRIQGELPPLAIPSTLQDSLLARLDQISRVKEVVQLGAVIGREFPLNLLSIVLGLDQSQILGSIRQLLDSEILYQIHLGNKELYQFKHALIQDAAYSAMLTSQRQQLHGQVARTYEDHFPEMINAQPEIVAHHYTRADLPLQAIPHWLKAGQMANEKHATQEAIRHLEQGLGLLGAVTNEADREQLELDFLLTLGGASIVNYGYTHPKVGKVFGRAKDLAQRMEISPKLAFIAYNLQTYYMLSENFSATDELTNFALEIGERHAQGYLFSLFGKHIHGVFLSFQGRFLEANRELRSAVDFYDPSIAIPSDLTPGGNVRINAASWLSLSLNISGFYDQGKAISEEHLRMAPQFADSRTLYHIFAWAAWRTGENREWEESLKIIEDYLPKAYEFGDPFFILVAELSKALAQAGLGDKAAIDRAIGHIETGISIGATIFYGHSSYTSQLLIENGEFDLALAWLDRALNHVAKTGYHNRTAEFHRLRGCCYRALGKPEEHAEKEFLSALEWAKKQGAKLYELRAARDLAALKVDRGYAEDGAQLLLAVYHSFTEGWESPDLLAARSQLEALGVTLD